MAVLVIEIIICIFYFVLLLIAAAKMSEIAETKGWDAASLHVFAWCFWFPLFGYLYVIALPDRTQYDEIMEYIKKDKLEEKNSKDVPPKRPAPEPQSKSKSYNLSEISSMSKVGNEDVKYWVCRKCKEKNPDYLKECQNCGTHK